MPRDNSPLFTEMPMETWENNGKKRVLFICGSLNQTTQMHQIAKELPEFDCYFTTYYVDGIIENLRKQGMLEFTIVGGSFLKQSIEYLKKNDLQIDYRGEKYTYDLVVRCGDLTVPKNTRYSKSVLVQEGMTDPKNLRYYLIRYLKILPRWTASTATFGLNDAYDKFSVASEGYRDHTAFFLPKHSKRKRCFKPRDLPFAF